jgi:hypothetical protein
MGTLSFLVFPESPARTEYGCGMAGNLTLLFFRKP